MLCLLYLQLITMQLFYYLSFIILQRKTQVSDCAKSIHFFGVGQAMQHVSFRYIHVRVH